MGIVMKDVIKSCCIFRINLLPLNFCEAVLSKATGSAHNEDPKMGIQKNLCDDANVEWRYLASE